MARFKAGAAQIDSIRNRTTAVFDRARKFNRGAGDTEASSDYANYLCVLVSGFLETTFHEIVRSYCDSRCDPRARNYVVDGVSRNQNLKATRLVQLLRKFDKDWSKELEAHLNKDGRREALDSVVELRNKIAHGESVPQLSLSRIDGYFQKTDEVVRFLQNMFGV